MVVTRLVTKVRWSGMAERYATAHAMRDLRSDQVNGLSRVFTLSFEGSPFATTA